MSTKSYYLYKKQVSYDGSNWYDVQPSVYSYDGDGSMTPVVKEAHDAFCGALPPIYRWIDTQDTMCVGYDKYVVQKRQVSYDNGLTWEDVTPSETRAGSLIEAYSEDCGYYPPIYKWENMNISTDYICDDCETIDYSTQYLTIESLDDDNSIYWYSSSTSNTKTISASTDGGQTWTAYTSSSVNGTLIATLNTGDKVFIKGNNSRYGVIDSYYNIFRPAYNKRSIVYGNIMSLIYGDNFSGQTTLTEDSTFYNLFGTSDFRNYGLTSAENLILPATSLTQDCYNAMFYNCENLTSAPQLPATTLADYCYDRMFFGCSGLTTAPALPATTLAQHCYQSMFMHCKNLTTAPVLSATTLAQHCYDAMFWGCDSLTTAPALPATTLADSCYRCMFYNCISLTTPPNLSATTLAEWCYNCMFEGCTSLTTAPELPATTLAKDCYSHMFNGCTNLTTAPVLSATTLAQNCYMYMFYSCSSLNYIKCLATNISASACLYSWVDGVASSGTFVKNASMSSWSTGISGIPSNWSVQNA